MTPADLAQMLELMAAALRAMPAGAASMSLRIRPQTVGSPSGTAMDVDVIEMGIEPASIT